MSATHVAARGARALRPVGWVAGLAGTVLVLHVLGRHELSAPPITSLDQFREWLDHRDAITAGFALLRLVALGAAWYLLAVTTLGLIARLLRAPKLVRLTDLAMLPPVRRLLGGVAGLGLTATVAASVLPGAALHHHTAVRAAGAPTTDPSRPGSREVVLQRLPDGARLVMPQPPDPSGDDGTDTMRVIDDRSPPPAPPRTWTIRPGDHFWHVAEAVLLHDWGRPADDGEISAYWRTLIDRNRSRLADPANPDLVYAGQELELPPSPAPAGGPAPGP